MKARGNHVANDEYLHTSHDLALAIIGKHTSPQLVDNQMGAFPRRISKSELMVFWLVRMLAARRGVYAESLVRENLSGF
jgi:hypothetical protein